MAVVWTGGQARVKLVVIDDLPHAAGPEQRARLAAALGHLATAARFPVVLIATVSSTQSSADDRSAPWHGLHKARSALRLCPISHCFLDVFLHAVVDESSLARLTRKRACQFRSHCMPHCSTHKQAYWEGTLSALSDDLGSHVIQEVLCCTLCVICPAGAAGGAGRSGGGADSVQPDH